MNVPRILIAGSMPETIRHVYEKAVEAYQVGSVLGGYVHLHFLSCPDFARRFVDDRAHWRAENRT
jgi:cobyrinic acid a,c-diamide synthase